MFINLVSGLLGIKSDSGSPDIVDIIKNEFCDIVNPEIGSVVKTDLRCHVRFDHGLTDLFPDHTGIYVGDDKIVELSGDGEIRVVSCQHFMKGDRGFTNMRDSYCIYAACSKNDAGDCYALASPDIAERALASVGKKKDYNLFTNNCHKFVEYCITGHNDGKGRVESIERALSEKFHLESPFSSLLAEHMPGTIYSLGNNVLWRSTGCVIKTTN